MNEQDEQEQTIELTEDEFADVVGSMVNVFGSATAEKFMIGFQHDEEFLKTFGSSYN